MATKKKRKGPPSIPQPQQVTPQTVPSFEKPTLQYEPFSFSDYTKLNDLMMQQQFKYAPQIMDLYNLSAQKNAATRMQLDQQYGLPMAQLKNAQLEAVDPQFMAMNRQLGAEVSRGLNFQDPAGQAIMADLAAGRNLGPGLEREVQQGIRGAQTARGNVLGAAPTAQEAFGIGSTAENLWQQRLANAAGAYTSRTGMAQNFLQGRQPTDMWGALNATEMYNPSSAYVDQSLGAQAANTIAGSQANYNSAYASIGNAYNQALISATGVNNEGMIQGAQVNNAGIQQQYSNQWDQYLYKQALQAGILTQPGVSTGGSGAMGMLGSIGSGVGSLLGSGALGTFGTAATAAAPAVASTGLIGAASTGLAGLGTAIGTGAAAIGSGVAAGASAIGAAVSAAGAAFCWLARKAIPDQWPGWREFIFTKADPELRRAYVYNARRLAMTLSWEDQVHIASCMKRALCNADKSPKQKLSGLEK